MIRLRPVITFGWFDAIVNTDSFITSDTFRSSDSFYRRGAFDVCDSFTQIFKEASTIPHPHRKVKLGYILINPLYLYE